MDAKSNVSTSVDKSAVRVAEAPKLGGSLENIANNLARADSKPLDYRRERWETRGFLWSESSLQRVRTCGRYSIYPDGSVQVRANGVTSGYAGLASCGSVWACPVCNARIQASRRLEVGTAIAVNGGSGGSAAFGAYTLQHHAKTDPDALWRSLSKCWECVTRDKMVKRTRQALGWVGTIRAAEVTHGLNGFHPHLHPVHMFAAAVSHDDVQELHAREIRAWRAAAARLGLLSPSEDAQHLHLVEGDASEPLGEYFTKAVYQPSPEGVSWEMTSTQTKSRTRATGSRTPWEILASAARDGDADDLDIWHSFEKASKGKRAISWSRGLRELVGVEVEASDQEIVDAQVGTVEDAGFEIVNWAPVRARPALGAELLSSIKNGADWGAGRRLCARNGIEIRDPVVRLALTASRKD